MQFSVKQYKFSQNLTKAINDGKGIKKLKN